MSIQKRRITRTRTVMLSFLLLCLLFLNGCGGTKLTVRLKENVEIDKIKRIAVLPIENLTSKRFAGEYVRRTVIAEFLSRGIDVIEPGEVTSVLRDKGVRTVSEISIEQLKEIGEELGVDAIISGSVGAYGISRGVSVSYPEVSLHLLMIDVSTGNIIWSAWATEGGPDFWTRHFGAEGLSLSETLQKVVEEMVDTLY